MQLMLRFDKTPKSPGESNKWQHCSYYTSVATQNAREFVSSCNCAVLSYVGAVAATAIAAHSLCVILYAELAKV